MTVVARQKCREREHPKNIRQPVDHFRFCRHIAHDGLRLSEHSRSRCGLSGAEDPNPATIARGPPCRGEQGLQPTGQLSLVRPKVHEIHRFVTGEAGCRRHEQERARRIGVTRGAEDAGGLVEDRHFWKCWDRYVHSRLQLPLGRPDRPQEGSLDISVRQRERSMENSS